MKEVFISLPISFEYKIHREHTPVIYSPLCFSINLVAKSCSNPTTYLHMDQRYIIKVRN